MSEPLPCSCFCGDVIFSATPSKMEMGVCHCSVCRRWRNGPWMTVSCSDYRIDDESRVGTYSSSSWAERIFCQKCGGAILSRAKNVNYNYVNVFAFSDCDKFTFGSEIFVDRKPDSYEFLGDHPRLTKSQIREAYGGEDATVGSSDTDTSKKCSCLCGSVTFSAVPDSHEIGSCHCSMCRHWSGGPTLGVACSDIRFDNEDSVEVYVSSDWAERVFCRDCGTSLLWRLHDGTYTHVSLGVFPDPDIFAFSTEVFVDSRPSLYEFSGSDQRNCMTEAEVFAAFGGSNE